MSSRTRRIVGIALVGAVVLLGTVFLLERHCPSEGLALSESARALHQLKNRTALPTAADFDERVTLASLMQPGEDTNRWSTSRAGRIEGYVVDVARSRPEAANCYLPCRRDVHILVAADPKALQNKQLVLEVTPLIADWAKQQGWDWSEATLKRQLIGHFCRFEGWLFFDSGHAAESENVSPNKPDNWRATAWEIHPITKLSVIE